MKRSLLFFTSSIALGALAGFLVSDFAKISAKLSPTAASVSPKAQKALAPARVASANTAFGRLINSTVAVVSPARAQKPLPVGSLVLNEPVVIVQGGAQPYTTIPQGSAVSFVKNEGRFMSVRHDRDIVTIPRTAVAVAVARAN